VRLGGLWLSCVAGVLAFFSLAATAIGGDGPNPNAGDTVLGTAGGFRYAKDRDPGDAENGSTLTVLAGCGSGKLAVTGGGMITEPAAVGEPSATVDAPADSSDRGSAPDDGWAATGTDAAGLTAFSICADAPAVTYRSEPVPPGDSVIRTAKLHCGGGLQVVGGGARIDAPIGWISRTLPLDGPDPDSKPDDGWRVGLDGEGPSNQVSMTAACWDGRVRYVEEEVPSPAFGEAVVTATCPKGTHVAGGGATSTGNIYRDAIRSSYPEDGADGDKIPDDGWTASVHNATPRAHKVRAYATCVG
jgi:hypothetical protein